MAQGLRALDSLAASMERIGLLHPILVSTERVLIAGERRLRAAERLGWKSIEARVTDVPSLEAERDENVERKNLTPSEKVALGREIELVEKAKAAERMTAGKKQPSGDSPEGPGDTRDRVGAAVGMAGPTYEKAKSVVEAAEADPEQGDLVEKMDETGKVESSWAEMRRRAGTINEPLRVVGPLDEHPCPTCGRWTPAWVLGRTTAPEGAKWRAWSNFGEQPRKKQG